MARSIQYPFPYFIVNEHFHIIQHPERSEEIFPVSDNFLDIVDEESRKKVVHQSINTKHGHSFEANLKTLLHPIQLFEIYPSMDHEKKELHLVCISQKTKYNEVSSQINLLREQLTLTNFSHYDKQMRKQLLPTIGNYNLSDVQIYDFLNNTSSIKEVPTKIDTIGDLLSIIRPDVIESGKSEYIELILDELHEMKQIIDSVITLDNIFKD